MNVKIVSGDLLNAKEDIIVHQVNCFGAIGGLAVHVFNKYPRAAKEYDNFVEQEIDKGHLLGHCLISMQPDGKIVANIFGQYYPGADYRPDSLRTAIRKLANYARAFDMTVAIPYKMSCGICGGDWDEVLKIIKEEMPAVKCTIYRRPQD